MSNEEPTTDEKLIARLEAEGILKELRAGNISSVLIARMENLLESAESEIHAIGSDDFEIYLFKALDHLLKLKNGLTLLRTGSNVSRVNQYLIQGQYEKAKAATEVFFSLPLDNVNLE